MARSYNKHVLGKFKMYIPHSYFNTFTGRTTLEI